MLFTGSIPRRLAGMKYFYRLRLHQVWHCDEGWEGCTINLQRGSRVTNMTGPTLWSQVALFAVLHRCQITETCNWQQPTLSLNVRGWTSLRRQVRNHHSWTTGALDETWYKTVHLRFGVNAPQGYSALMLQNTPLPHAHTNPLRWDAWWRRLSDLKLVQGRLCAKKK